MQLLACFLYLSFPLTVISPLAVSIFALKFLGIVSMCSGPSTLIRCRSS